MTYKNIYTKFMIEYDKANITSSYPSLTEYEVATILDKAYLALIGQKVSGNNLRRSTIESDIKSISDIQPLITSEDLSFAKDNFITNRLKCNLDLTKFLYFVGVSVHRNNKVVPIKLIPHESAEKFFETDYNKPWIKIPVCYIEDNKLYVLYDPEDKDENNQLLITGQLLLTYIKRPTEFVGNINDEVNFQCNDSMAEELISLAVTFALENVESTRLNTKLNTRGLEA